jgi:hypothetical protein
MPNTGVRLIDEFFPMEKIDGFMGKFNEGYPHKLYSSYGFEVQ